MPKKVITWVEGLKGISGIVIFFNHLRSCVWPESSHASSPDGQQYIIAYPFLSLLFAGNLAVRLYFVMSGFALVYRPLQMMQSGQEELLYQRTSIQLQSRFWRLWVPSAVAAFISLLMTWVGAFEHGRHVCAAFDKVTPRSNGFSADLWLYIKDTTTDMWVVGVHHFHDSLWCMKLLLVGSYIMYSLTIMTMESRRGVWVWWLIGACLLSPAVAALDFARSGTDLAGFVFGGVIASTIIKLDSEEDKTAVDADKKWREWAPKSILWSLCLLCSLGLGCYPHGSVQGQAWFEWMFGVGRFIIDIANPRQIMTWWLNIAAFLICLCICHLPLVQHVLGLPCLQYLGKTSFAFFLLHPLILRSLGAHVLTLFDVPRDTSSGFNSDIPPLMTIVLILPLALLASHYWSVYVEGKLHSLVEKHLILRKKASPALPT